MPLLRSWLNFIEPAVYKRYVPPGLPDKVRTFAQKQETSDLLHRDHKERTGKKLKL